MKTQTNVCLYFNYMLMKITGLKVDGAEDSFLIASWKTSLASSCIYLVYTLSNILSPHNWQKWLIHSDNHGGIGGKLGISLHDCFWITVWRSRISLRATIPKGSGKDNSFKSNSNITPTANVRIIIDRNNAFSLQCVKQNCHWDTHKVGWFFFAFCFVTMTVAALDSET